MPHRGIDTCPAAQQLSTGWIVGQGQGQGQGQGRSARLLHGKLQALHRRLQLTPVAAVLRAQRFQLRLCTYSINTFSLRQCSCTADDYA